MAVFWIICGILALALAALVMRAARSEPDAEPRHSDVAIYKSQLAEVDRDLARGVITDGEAADLRLEVQRRLLAADKSQGQQAKTSAAGHTGLILAIGATLALAFATYWLIGAPGYGDLPLAARKAALDQAAANRPDQATAQAEYAAVAPLPGTGSEHLKLVEQLRAALEARPDDIRGLMLLARNESILGNYDAALAAQQRILDLKGDAVTAQDLLDRAELLVVATGGYVSPEAEALFRDVLAVSPQNGPARYFLGLMYDQNGRYDLAFGIWRALLEENPGPTPWSEPIRSVIEDTALRAGVNRYAPPPRPRGPSAEDVEAAQDMTAQERQQMIQGMVNGLAERLGEQGGPPQDWARLVAALGVLGRQEDAAQILLEARTIFAGDASAARILDQAADQAGIAR